MSRGASSDAGYFGQTVAQRCLAGVTFTESAYRAGQSLPSHRHPEATLCYVLRGGFEERWTDGESDLSEGMLIYRPPDYLHSDRFIAPTCLTFSLDLTGALAEAGPSRPTAIRGSKSRGVVSRIYREFGSPDDCSALAVESLIHLLHDELSRLPSESGQRPPRWLLDIRERLEDEFQQTPLLADLALQANVHPMHLTKRFQFFFGCSVGDFLRHRRVEHGRRLLEETDLTIGEISLAAGFADQAHFTRVFHAATGRPPAAHRRETRKASIVQEP